MINDGIFYFNYNIINTCKYYIYLTPSVVSWTNTYFSAAVYFLLNGLTELPDLFPRNVEREKWSEWWSVETRDKVDTCHQRPVLGGGQVTGSDTISRLAPLLPSPHLHSTLDWLPSDIKDWTFLPDHGSFSTNTNITQWNYQPALGWRLRDVFTS